MERIHLVSRGGEGGRLGRHREGGLGAQMGDAFGDPGLRYGLHRPSGVRDCSLAGPMSELRLPEASDPSQLARMTAAASYAPRRRAATTCSWSSLEISFATCRG